MSHAVEFFNTRLKPKLLEACDVMETVSPGEEAIHELRDFIEHITTDAEVYLLGEILEAIAYAHPEWRGVPFDYDSKMFEGIP